MALAALARLFAVATQPDPPCPRRRPRHRRGVARPDRAGGQPGCAHLCRTARRICPNVTPTQRRKRVLADGLPHRPGVYLFRGPSGEVLYVGTSVDLRRRVEPVLQRRRPPRPDEGDGRAGRRGRPRRVRPRAGGRRAGAADAGRARSAVQPPVEVPAALVVGGTDRRGIPAAVGGAGPATRPRHRAVSLPHRSHRHRDAAGAVHRSPNVHQATRPFGPARTRLPRRRSVALPRRPRRDRGALRRGDAARRRP